MEATKRHKDEIGEGWWSCTGWLELPLDAEGIMHEHAEVTWLEHDGTRETAYLDLETGAEYDEEPVADKQWSHSWAENMRAHWIAHCKWRPTDANKLQ